MSIVNNKWDTARLKAFEHNFKLTGVIPDDHPYFNRKIGKRKGGLDWGYTKEELVELARCEEDIVYFANNHCKILTKKGRKILKEVGGLRDYQEEILKQFKENKYSIVLASRQIGKSITVAIFVVWYIIFHEDANILLLSATGKKAKDLLAKIAEIQNALPFYMQIGLVNDATQKRLYDNGCSLMSENTTENAGISGSFEFVYWDEMALLDAEMQDKIFTGVFPTMSNFGDEAKFIITSTPRGRRNKFYKIWAGAIAEPDSPSYNGFSFSKVYWYDVAGRDKEWARKEKILMGESGFAREYDLSFDAEENLLLEDDIKKKMNSGLAGYKRVETIKGGLRLMEGFHLEFFSDPNRKFHISIDIASGKKKDYTVFNIFEIIKKSDSTIKKLEFFESELDFFSQKQVGIIRSNKYKPEIMAKFLCQILDDYFDCENDNVKLTVEMNHKGEIFIEKLFSYGGLKNGIKEYRDQIIVQYPRHCDFELEETFDDGIVQSTKSKKDATDTINTKIDAEDIIITEAVTADEGLSFGLNKKGNYEGLSDNDDCFMTVLNASHFTKTEEYAEWVSFIYDTLYPEEKLVIDELLEIGSSGDDSDDIY